MERTTLEVVSAPLNPVGIDKGLTTRMALSDGRYVPARTVPRCDYPPVPAAPVTSEVGISITCPQTGRPRQGSGVGKPQKARDADFRRAHDLVACLDGLAVENLNIAGLLRSRRYSKKTLEQRWGAFDLVLGHKAQKAGVPYVKVSPSHTSTDCSRRGHRQEMPLGTRVYRCGRCRPGLCRDGKNTARNIRARAFPQVRGREGIAPDAASYTKQPPQDRLASRGGDASGRRRTVCLSKPCVGTQIYKPQHI